MQGPFHLFPLHNAIQKTMLKQEFRLLKTGRQLLTDGLLDHTGTCKANQCTRFCQNDVTQHSKAGRHTSGRRIRQHTDIKKAGIAVTADGCGGLGHLHERSHPFLHPGSSGANKKDHRKAVFRCPFHRSGDLFSHHFSHACHEKTAVTDAEGCRDSVDPSLSCEHSLIQSCFFPETGKLLQISTVSHWIFFFQIGIPLFKASLIQHLLDPVAGMHSEIVSAAGTDILILSGLLHKNRSFADLTTLHKSIRDLCVLFPQDP